MMDWHAESHVGLVRQNNEDSYAAEPELGLFLVADGLGGAVAGERASKIAVDTVVAGARSPQGGAAAQILVEAVERANRNIINAASQDPALRGMGTTVTAAIVCENRLQVVNAGDSRAYLWRDGALERVTEDHTWIRDLEREGVSPEKLKNHPYRNMLTKAVGCEARVQPDTYKREFRPGDILLLSSDGLHGFLEHAEIARILGSGESLKERAEGLISATLDLGAPDNVTVVLVRHP